MFYVECMRETYYREMVGGAFVERTWLQPICGTDTKMVIRDLKTASGAIRRVKRVWLLGSNITEFHGVSEIWIHRCQSILSDTNEKTVVHKFKRGIDFGRNKSYVK